MIRPDPMNASLLNHPRTWVLRRRLCAVVLLGLSPGLAMRAAAQPAGGGGKIIVETVGLRSDAGSVLCLLFASAPGFPGDPSKAIQRATGPIHAGRAACEFPDPAPGSYAAATAHDENGNGKIDTNFLGIPKEGVAVSNDAKGFLGPPKFDAARFVFSGGTLNLRVHVLYL